MTEANGVRHIPASAVDCVIDARAQIGEGAIWSVDEQVLWWVDIPAGRLHRYDPASGLSRHWDFFNPLGCVALTASGRVVLALSTGFHEFDPANGSLSKLSGPAPHLEGLRYNDGTVDTRGRFIAGTMPVSGSSLEAGPRGVLYSLEAPAGEAPQVVERLDGFYTVNGLACSPDGRTIYVADSHASVRTIWQADYDADTGAWSDRRVFFDTRGIAGRPDGAALDSDGCYWMAGVGGWQLARITPAGKLDCLVDMPVEKPTRIAFGGAALDTLYVTSIGVGLDAATRDKQPQAGGVFAVKVPGVQGIAMPVMPR